MQENIIQKGPFTYENNIRELAVFEGSHPEVMKPRIKAMNWKFSQDISYKRRTVKEVIRKTLKRYFNIQLGYKNYKVI